MVPRFRPQSVVISFLSGSISSPNIHLQLWFTFPFIIVVHHALAVICAVIPRFADQTVFLQSVSQSMRLVRVLTNC